MKMQLQRRHDARPTLPGVLWTRGSAPTEPGARSITIQGGKPVIGTTPPLYGGIADMADAGKRQLPGRVVEISLSTGHHEPLNQNRAITGRPNAILVWQTEYCLE